MIQFTFFVDLAFRKDLAGWFQLRVSRVAAVRDWKKLKQWETGAAGGDWFSCMLFLSDQVWSFLKHDEFRAGAGLQDNSGFQGKCFRKPILNYIIFSEQSSEVTQCYFYQFYQLTSKPQTPGEGHGNLLQYSCLENPMDRGAWWATVSPWGHRELDMTEVTQHTCMQASSPLRCKEGNPGHHFLRKRDFKVTLQKSRLDGRYHCDHLGKVQYATVTKGLPASCPLNL